MGWQFDKLNPSLQKRIALAGLAPEVIPSGQTPKTISKIKGVMNSHEKDFYDNYLRPRQSSGEFGPSVYEGVTLPIAYKCTYSPDFVLSDGIGPTKYFECKAPHRFRTAGVYKLKFAAQTYKEDEFYLCEKKKGKWTVTRVPYDPNIRLKSFVSPEPQEDE